MLFAQVMIELGAIDLLVRLTRTSAPSSLRLNAVWALMVRSHITISTTHGSLLITTPHTNIPHHFLFSQT